MNLRLGYLPGCIGRIAEMHGSCYARTVGFGATFEAKVAADGQRIHGSIAIDGSQHPESGAHLRWFISSDEARGTGVGSRLLEAAMAFCETQAYRGIHLWTFDELHAARRLYEKHGFVLTHTQRGSQWGKEVDEQRFTLDRA